jgi:hypothetical protein
MIGLGRDERVVLWFIQSLTMQIRKKYYSIFLIDGFSFPQREAGSSILNIFEI